MTHIGLNALLLSVAAGYHNAGMSAALWRLIHALARYDDRHNYTLFHSLGEGTELPAFRQPVRLVAVAGVARRALARIVWEQLCLARAAAGCDLLHCPVNVLPPGFRGARVVTVHDLAFLQHPAVVSAQRRWYLRRMIGASLRRADHVIAISGRTRADILHTWSLDPARVSVIWPAIDPDLAPIADPARLAAWRTAQGLTRPYLLFLGTIEPRKNLEMLVRAFALARHRGLEEAQLVLAGAQDWDGGTVIAQLRTVIRALGLEREVLLPGYLPEADRALWYSGARAFALPSWSEGFGLPAAEAMACGTPVLASMGGSLPEVVGAGGALARPDDPRGWAELIMRAMRDDAWHAEHAEAARRQASCFGEERMARGLMALYDDVLTRSHPRELLVSRAY